MAQDTAGHFATPPVKGTGSRNYFRFGEWKIGRILPAFFATIVLLMTVGDIIAVLQLNRKRTSNPPIQTDRVRAEMRLWISRRT